MHKFPFQFANFRLKNDNFPDGPDNSTNAKCIDFNGEEKFLSFQKRENGNIIANAMCFYCEKCIKIWNKEFVSKTRHLGFTALFSDPACDFTLKNKNKNKEDLSY